MPYNNTHLLFQFLWFSWVLKSRWSQSSIPFWNVWGKSQFQALSGLWPAFVQCRWHSHFFAGCSLRHLVSSHILWFMIPHLQVISGTSDLSWASDLSSLFLLRAHVIILDTTGWSRVTSRCYCQMTSSLNYIQKVPFAMWDHVREYIYEYSIQGLGLESQNSAYRTCKSCNKVPLCHKKDLWANNQKTSAAS